MAPAGKTAPQAELEATLAQFFSTELVGRSRQPAQCAFMARYRWLKHKLSFDDERLPPLSCERFHAWLAELNPQSISLIFPAAFMNNPASMFGHTFLRLNQKGQTDQTRILAYTINYAADVPPDAGVEFALFGIFGGYKGFFSTIPYYIKVQEYRDLENRDIWEYRLNFNDDQIEWMLMHAWELGNAYFDYFFFKENCAYHILSLLEIANPELHLTDQFFTSTIPADTIRLLFEEPNLVGKIDYRPSRSTQIKRKREGLSEQEKDWVEQLIYAPSTTDSPTFREIPVDRQAFVLDLATDYLRFKSLADREHADAYKQKNRALLVSRSRLKVRSPLFPIHPFTVSPEQGHKSKRATIGIGWREDEIFEEFALRGAYHDLLDPDAGYTRDAQIELLSASVRHYEKSDQYRIERVTLANVISLSPIDSLFKTPSWKAKIGMDTVRTKAGQLRSNGNFNGGIGAAIETQLINREVYFVFAEVDANYSSAYKENHRVGGGGTIGLLSPLTDRWKILFSTTYLGYPLGDKSDDYRVFVGMRYTLQQNWALRTEFNHRDHDNQAAFFLQTYF